MNVFRVGPLPSAVIQGILLVILAAVCFGFMPLFGSWTKGSDLSIWMLLALRFCFAAPVLWAIVWWKKEKVPRGWVFWTLVLMGSIGYVTEASCFFGALKYIPSGLVSLLLYLYPGLVTLIAWLFLKEKLTTGKIVALFLALAGSALLIVPSFGKPLGDNAMIGIAMGLGMALSYGLYIIAGTKTGERAGPMVSSAVVITSAAVVFVIITLARGDQLPTTRGGWMAAGALSLFATVIAITALLAGLARIGPVRTSTLSILEPAVTVVVGVTLLGEEFSMVQYAGGACVLGAAVLTARSKT